MKVNDFDYNLPEELIAQEPLLDRKESRLLILDKESGKTQHKKFVDILDYLTEGDCLILNDTRVIPARLLGNKEDTGAKIEFLLLRRVNSDIWEVILKPGRKARVGARFVFGNGELKAEVIEIVEDGNRLVRFEYDGRFEEILDRVGMMPLPPYINHKLEDKERYQTVYAKKQGSAAAPTAGLHFTKELLDRVREKGIKIAYVTLHVGLGTFRPVKTDSILEHKMHSEFYTLDIETCRIINEAKDEGKKVFAVGTTSVRVLETCTADQGVIEPGSGYTDIFIYPGYKFKCVDGLITNFHLPKSTLLMLVSAFSTRENILKAYEEAISEKYRFFSFGDAMMII